VGAGELARITGEIVGDDATTRHILAEAERNFPMAPDDPARPRPPVPAGGDDEFGDSSILG